MLIYLQEKDMSEIVDPCTQCGLSTEFGSGRYVNRIVSDDSYMCEDCQMIVCDYCNKARLHYILHNNMVICQDCAEEYQIEEE